jgi:protoporphyrinogen oxidase
MASRFSSIRSSRVAIIGAGPAGLTAAYVLSKNGVPVTVVESDPQYVGGLARTVHYKGFCFDIGGHRFFSKSKEVEDFWTEILPHDMLELRRSSRILYNGQFFSYPLKAFEALSRLGPLESVLCLLSYLKACAFPVPNPASFEDWVSNQFGQRLFRIFFKTYTEKVWGMSCKEISADWAAQRIKGLSLASAVKTALLPERQVKDRKQVVKTLADTFHYPRRGPGMMWEACAAKVMEMGGEVLMGRSVSQCAWLEEEGEWEVAYEPRALGGAPGAFRAAHVISSAPISHLVSGLIPKPPEPVMAASKQLRHRDFLTVALMVKDRHAFADHWIYIHDPSVRIGRIQNYKSWSPEMVPDPAFCCYGLEYFCFEGDSLWKLTDGEMIDLARRELEVIGLTRREDVVDGCVVRQREAYPVYDGAYAKNVRIIRDELERSYPRLQVVGRNGMHKYNNQDHAMMTGMLAARNILSDVATYDVWQVNQDAEYHEAGTTRTQSTVSGLRAVPERLSS